MWKILRLAVGGKIDKHLKAKMILRSQEVILKVKTEDMEKILSCQSDIVMVRKNYDSVDTAKKVFEVVHATFQDHSGYDVYMKAKIMKRLQLKYDVDDYNNKGCITRMIITRKSELNELMNKRTESTHQTKMSSKRTGTNNATCKGKGTFTMKGPSCSGYYNRNCLVFSTN